MGSVKRTNTAAGAHLLQAAVTSVWRMCGTQSEGDGMDEGARAGRLSGCVMAGSTQTKSGHAGRSSGGAGPNHHVIRRGKETRINLLGRALGMGKGPLVSGCRSSTQLINLFS